MLYTEKSFSLHDSQLLGLYWHVLQSLEQGLHFSPPKKYPVMHFVHILSDLHAEHVIEQL